MAKIRTTLELIREKLNESFKNADPTQDQWVVLSNLVDHGGRPYQDAKNKLVIFLANIQNENTVSTYRPTVPTGDAQYAAVAPPLYIDVFLLCLANFYDANYADGLGVISQTIAFFQQNPCFTHDTLPDLDPSIDKLTFEMTNLDLSELNHLLGMTGANYLPAVYYKVRMIPFASDAMEAVVPAAQAVETPGEIEDPSGPERE